MPDAARDDWVRRVLGVARPDKAGGAQAKAGVSGAVRAALKAWREASEAVDLQVAQLQAVLRGSDDADLRDISEFGMAALSGGNRTGLMAAAMELERSDVPPPALLKRAATIAAKFRSHLAKDRKVQGFDSNPFGIHVSIRATLEPALQQLETAALKAA